MRLDPNQVVAVVLAGGFGTRVAHLLPGIPKPMAPVAGKPFLEWVARYLARQSIRNVVFSTGHLSDVIEDYFRKEPVIGIKTRCVAETQPLGTAGGFLHAARHSGESPAAWLVLNGDSLVLTDLEPAWRAMADPAISGVVLGCVVEDASRYGTLAVSAGGELTGFAEKRPGRGVINAGVYLLRDSVLAAMNGPLPLSFETDVFPRLLREKARIKVVEVRAPFLDIGTPNSLREAERFVRENRSQFEP